jgi:hypothetical protein
VHSAPEKVRAGVAAESTSRSQGKNYQNDIIVGLPNQVDAQVEIPAVDGERTARHQLPTASVHEAGTIWTQLHSQSKPLTSGQDP